MVGSPSCDPLGVLQGVLDADVPVHGDEAQVEDGGGAAEDVSCQPYLAGDGPEDPFPQHRVGNVQGEHRDGNLKEEELRFVG